MVFAAIVALFAGGSALLLLALRHPSAAASLRVSFDLAPDGRHIVFTGQGRHSQGVYLLDMRTHQVTRLVDDAGPASDPVFSPDGRSIYYAAASSWDGPFHVFRLALPGGAVTQLTRGPASDGQPSVSPDGRTVVFTRATRRRPYSMGGTAWDDYSLCTVGADGSGLRTVTDTSYFSLSAPTVSPDGSRIYVVGIPHGGPDAQPDQLAHLYQMAVHGAAEPQSMDFSHTTAGGVLFSRDGQLAVYASSVYGQYSYDIYVKHMRGVAPALPLHVNRLSPQNYNPIPSADGARVFYLQGDFAYDQPVELWTVEADGSHPSRVADSKLFLDPLKWKP